MSTHDPNSAIAELQNKTTLACSLVTIVLLLPFTVSHAIQKDLVLTVANCFIILLCLVNAGFCLRGQHNQWVSLLLLLGCAITLVYAFFKMGVPASYPLVLLVFALYLMLPERRALAANIVLAAVLLPVSFYVLELPSAARFAATITGVSVFAFIASNEINRLHRRLQERVVTDELTGLFNRTLLMPSIEQAIARQQRTEVPSSLIAFDVDEFKAINDTAGHLTGDTVLRAMGEILRRHSRKTDQVFRVGGEEFLVLAHNANAKQASGFADNIRREVQSASLLPDRQVTISVGVSEWRSGMTPGQWVERADEKLYRAKANGRNCVVV